MRIKHFLLLSLCCTGLPGCATRETAADRRGGDARSLRRSRPGGIATANHQHRVNAQFHNSSPGSGGTSGEPFRNAMKSSRFAWRARSRRCSTVSNHFRRRTPEERQVGKIFVERHDRESVRAGMFPNEGVGGAIETEQFGLRGIRKNIGKTMNQPVTQVVVKQQFHAASTQWSCAAPGPPRIRGTPECLLP